MIQGRKIVKGVEETNTNKELEEIAFSENTLPGAFVSSPELDCATMGNSRARVQIRKLKA